MRQRKKRLEMLTFYNVKAISAHLEKMALKGWMLEKIVNTGWIYRRIEPKKLRFAVSYYPKASEYDPEPTPGQQEFLDFCAHTGWHLACTCAQMQIFYNEQENPIPVETEPKLEVEAIHASVRKTFLVSYIVLILVGLFYSWLFLMSLLGNPIATFANTTQLLLGLMGFCLVLLCGTELVLYYRWHSKAEVAAENGLFLSPPDTVVLQRIVMTIVVLGGAYYAADYMINGDSLRRWVLLAMCVYAPTLFFLVNATKEFLKKKKASRGLNRVLTIATSFVLAFALLSAITHITLWANSNRLFDAEKETYEHNGITWVVHRDELPLVVEDLMEADPEMYIKERSGNESFLLGNFRLHQFARFDLEDRHGLPELDYRMVRVKLPALYDTCKNRLIYEMERLKASRSLTCQPEDPAPWGAKEAYRLQDPEYGDFKQYLLCYDNLLVELELSWEPTQEQKTIICQKLAGKDG